MSDAKVIKGITWDHPRGYEPLRAIAALWNMDKAIQVKWEVRSLREFGDCPVEQLIDRFDLLVIDHPYVGSASVNQLLVPLDEHLPAACIELQRAESLGPGFETYWYAEHIRALPLDAAAQVGAYRRDLTDALQWPLPDDVTRLKENAATLPAGMYIGVPLCPTDIWCVFLSLCALYADGKFFSEDGIDQDTGEWAVAQINSWKTFLHEESFNMNPIQMLEHMADLDDIVYVPFTFGYTNYARPGWRNKLVHFCNGPVYQRGRHCALLGGAGIAISSKTNYLQEALGFVQFAVSRSVQSGIYFHEQGQPAHISAWRNAKNNIACSGFFSNTMDTMLNAYVRPRHNRFNLFQEMAADHIHRSVLIDTRPDKTVSILNSMYQKLVNAYV